MLDSDSSFYLSVTYFKTETHASVEGKNWFKAQPMGVNKLNNIVKDTSQAAGIPGETNHSGRKTLVQKLRHSGVPPNRIIQITGIQTYSQLTFQFSARKANGEYFTYRPCHGFRRHLDK